MITSAMDLPMSRRRMLALISASAGLAGCAAASATATDEPYFLTRGVILAATDIRTWAWKIRAAQARLNVISTHFPLSQEDSFTPSDEGRTFVSECAREGIHVEREMHAMSLLLPRALFEKNPTMFRMNEKGERVPDANLCVSSPEALEVVRENAIKDARLFQPSTHRYFYWIDDGMPMCGCGKCKALSDSDQALLVEIEILKALRTVDPKATLAHLCYHNTLKPPTQIKPVEGIFLEYAPIKRRYDIPLSNIEGEGHTDMLAALDANLAVFGAEGAQALEYWLDVSRFSQWKRDTLTRIPWQPDVFKDDLATYAKRGIRHITTFACWADGEYVARFGEPPVQEYGEILHSFKRS